MEMTPPHPHDRNTRHQGLQPPPPPLTSTSVDFPLFIPNLTAPFSPLAPFPKKCNFPWLSSFESSFFVHCHPSPVKDYFFPPKICMGSKGFPLEDPPPPPPPPPSPRLSCHLPLLFNSLNFSSSLPPPKPSTFHSPQFPPSLLGSFFPRPLHRSAREFGGFSVN